MKYLFIFLISFIFLFSSAQQTLITSGRHITTPCGDTVLLRGVNKMNIWTDITGETMHEIAQSGANSVRIVWAGTGKGRAGGMSGTAQQLDKVISNCIKEGMIPIPECHDATGDQWEVITEVVKYWTRPDIVAVLKKHEAYSILNIANEAGVKVPDSLWFETYKNAISKIRATGLKLPLMIDGDGWGQNTEKFFQFGIRLIELDPEHNIIFSFHPWWPSSSFGSVQEVVEKIDVALEKSIKLNIPLIVGEFAHHAPGCALEIPHKKIMEMCHWKKMSWLAWSWGPGNSDCRDMDMTQNGTFETFKHDSWAEDVLTGYYGLQRTSKKLDYITHYGECAPYCERPTLPKRLLICENETIEISSTLKGKNINYDWSFNGKTVGANATLEVNTPGMYQLTTDIDGCKKSTSTLVESKLPTIILPNTKDLCEESLLLIDVNPKFENVNYTWKIDSKEFSNTSLLSTDQSGSYSVTASRNSCSITSNTMEVQSPYLIVKNKSIAYEGEVYLKVKGGSGKYAWYSSPNGGSPAGRGKEFNPYVSKTTTFYVEDEGDPRCKRTPITVTMKK